MHRMLRCTGRELGQRGEGPKGGTTWLVLTVWLLKCEVQRVIIR